MFFYKENEVKAASYSRLSREDGDKMESDSIRNQKDLIADYAAQRGYPASCPSTRMTDTAERILIVRIFSG